MQNFEYKHKTIVGNLVGRNYKLSMIIYEWKAREIQITNKTQYLVPSKLREYLLLVPPSGKFAPSNCCSCESWHDTLFQGLDDFSLVRKVL